MPRMATKASRARRRAAPGGADDARLLALLTAPRSCDDSERVAECDHPRWTPSRRRGASPRGGSRRRRSHCLGDCAGDEREDRLSALFRRCADVGCALHGEPRRHVGPTGHALGKRRSRQRARLVAGWVEDRLRARAHEASEGSCVAVDLHRERERERLQASRAMKSSQNAPSSRRQMIRLQASRTRAR
jgi:hypothetical protein